VHRGRDVLAHLGPGSQTTEASDVLRLEGDVLREPPVVAPVEFVT
jgi:hypothetical protein